MRGLVAALLVAVVVAGCSGQSGPAASPASSPTRTSVTISAADRGLCQQLYARLQRVTAALDASSELLTGSINPQQLGGQIAVEQHQLQLSAQLLGRGRVPAPLEATNRDLIAALQKFSSDFAQAAAPAARGDFQSAVQAMTDQPTVTRIVQAATTIQHACG